jgi:hypothetical protein
MKIYLSHARKDRVLARRLATALIEAGFDVWDPEDAVTPGENWAKKTGQALAESEMMVLLFTPRALDSDALRQDFEFAIGSKKYAQRVFSVIVGESVLAGSDVPWILYHLPHRRVDSAAAFGDVVKDVLKLSASIALSASHA